jgi:hypothetical protein
MKAGDAIGLYGLYSYDDDGGDPNLGNTHYIKSFHFIFGDGTSHYEAYPYPGFDGNTEHTYNSPMLYTVKLDVYDNDAAEGGPPDKNDVDICQLAVVKVNLNINGVPDDSNELNPGGLVSLNNDDDNNNGIEDKDEAPVNGEDDLVAISLSILPANLDTGEMELKVVNATSVRIWSSADKQGLIIPTGDPLDWSKKWPVQQMPQTLYVEGTSVPYAREVLLQLSYIVDLSECIHSVLVRFSVVKVDIDAGLNEIDEVNPGKYINVNWNDDDGDGWTPNDTPPNGVYAGDKDDSEIVLGDGDLRLFWVSISPYDLSSYFPDTKVRITFPDKVKVWETNTKKKLFGLLSSELPSGSEFTLENLPTICYLEGISGSGGFRDVDLKATYLPCGSKDTVKVTVFEVTLTGLFGFGPQQPIEENDKRHSFFQGSSDKNGKISWDDANADGTKGDLDTNCEYFHNCMECQGTVKPSGVTNQVEFDFDRKCWSRMWTSEDRYDWDLEWDKTPWYPDDLREDDEDKTVSSEDHIYQTDGPGLTWDDCPPNYVSHVANLKEWVRVKIDGSWYQCSNYYKWHSKVQTQPKGSTGYITREDMAYQRLGSGWIFVNPPQ